MKKDQNNTARRNPKIVILLIVLAIVIGAIAGGVYAVMNTRIFEEKPLENVESPPGAKQPETLYLDDAEDESINILILGIDESQHLTDVMMMANIDTKSGAINILQIPRDTYVGDDTVETGKINAVYGHPKKGEASIDGLVRVVNSKFKVSIDHYATITLDKFREVVDILGGVPVDIKQDIYWDDNTTLEEGYHLLSGHEAEMFIRYRKGYATGDIGRMGATKQFMESLIDMMFNMSSAKVIQLGTSCYDKITTDMTINEMLKLYNIVKDMDKDKIEFFMIPGEGIASLYNGYAIYAVDRESFVEILNNRFRPNTDKKLEAEDLPLEDAYDIIDELGGTGYGDIDYSAKSSSKKSSTSASSGNNYDSSSSKSSSSKSTSSSYDYDDEDEISDNDYVTTPNYQSEEKTTSESWIEQQEESNSSSQSQQIPSQHSSNASNASSKEQTIISE